MCPPLSYRGLRAATWEAVPGLKLVLYPHQRNALSWMLHREVNGGQRMEHPYVRQYVTGGDGEGGGWPVYLNQVRRLVCVRCTGCTGCMYCCGCSTVGAWSSRGSFVWSECASLC
jgi:hypothetical protein